MSEYYWVNALLTLVWVIGIMNSINMLDNMDGITSITSIFIFLATMVFMALHGLHSQTDFLIMLGAVSTLVAFLFFNWNPSKMYMGDTGSQFLGIVLAIVGIRYFWNSSQLDGDISQWQQLFAVVLAFMLPIIDTSIVTINRLSRGQSPFVGGKDHTTHNLSYLGLSDSQVALTFALVSLVNLFILYFLFRFVEEWTLSLGIGLTAYVLAFFTAALIMTRRLRHHYI